MARYTFGGSPDAIAQDARGNVIPFAEISVWSARTGGTQITDLLDAEGDPADAGRIYADSNGLVSFSGPDGVSEVYIDSGVGSRLKLRSGDIDLSGIEARIATVESQLEGAGGDYLPLAGGTLTGDVTLPGDPDTNLKAATKAYVDNAIAAQAEFYPVAIYVSETEPTDLRQGVLWIDISGALPPDPPSVNTLFDQDFDALTLASNPTAADVGASSASGTSTQVTVADTVTMGHGRHLHVDCGASRTFTFTFVAEQTEVIFRGYIRYNEALASNNPVMLSVRGASATVCAQLQWGIGGLRMRDGTTVGGAIQSMTEDAVYRFEWRVAANSTQTLKLWASPESASSPTSSADHTSTQNGVTSFLNFQFGCISGPVTGFTYDLDELRCDAGNAQIGPA